MNSALQLAQTSLYNRPTHTQIRESKKISTTYIHPSDTIPCMKNYAAKSLYLVALVIYYVSATNESTTTSKVSSSS